MQEERKIIWWKDIKFLMGGLLITLSFVLGTFDKGLFFAFIGIFLMGMKTIKMIRQRIHSQVKKTVRGAYEITKELPKKGLNYTKEFKFTKTIISKIKH